MGHFTRKGRHPEDGHDDYQLSWYVLSDFRWSKWSAQHLTNIYDREGVRMQIMLPMYLSWQLALGCSSQILCFPWDRYQD